MIAEFWQLAQRTVDNSLLEFLATSRIETSPNPSAEKFHYLIGTKVEQFKLELSQSLMNILELLREVIHINQSVTILRSNWKFANLIPIGELAQSDVYIAAMIPVLYGDCDCGLSKNCVRPMTDSNYATILGLMTGCYPLEELLQSSLECFYDEKCFQMMTISSSSGTSLAEISSLVLNASIPSRYHPNTTVEEILNNIFIEEWTINISYEEYYKVCAPSSCSHFYLESASILEIVTNLLSLYDGVTIIIENIIVPLIIHLCCLLTRPSGRVETINH